MKPGYRKTSLRQPITTNRKKPHMFTPDDRPMPAWIGILTFDNLGLVKATTTDRATTVFLDLPGVSEYLKAELPSTLQEALHSQVERQLDDAVLDLEHRLEEAKEDRQRHAKEPK